MALVALWFLIVSVLRSALYQCTRLQCTNTRGSRGPLITHMSEVNKENLPRPLVAMILTDSICFSNLVGHSVVISTKLF